MQIALTIAGSDSGGGAGIQADLKTFARFGVFGTSVITAVTAQNTRGVAAWTAVPVGLIRAQVDALADDLPPAALKTGMLADARVVTAVADAIQERGLTARPYVLDPVMVATSGDVLLEPAAVDAVRVRLLPLAALITPNVDEAAILVGHAVRDASEMERAGRALVDAGAGAALVKGGHLPGPEVVNVLVADSTATWYRHSKLETRNLHGTGCTLSAAITAMLALGRPLPDAVRESLDYVHRAIATAPGLGGGHGPLNHFA
jgi:hydroxymethylpyrimidine/phosphomethylpyrimidine kinase